MHVKRYYFVDNIVIIDIKTDWIDHTEPSPESGKRRLSESVLQPYPELSSVNTYPLAGGRVGCLFVHG